MLVSDFDYELPDGLIAQHPNTRRNQSRMLAMDRATGVCDVRRFTDLKEYLDAGDCLVINDTKVIPARLHGRKDPGGGAVEALVLEEIEAGECTALLRPGRRLKTGTRVRIDGEIDAFFEVRSRGDDGSFRIRFSPPDVQGILDQTGTVPLPPYIKRPAAMADTERYQTVYARRPGAVAAPTAGLHFDNGTLDALAAAGIRLAPVTLHVGVATFQPVSVSRVTDHPMHGERFELSNTSARLINQTRAAGRQVIAVGTTAVRVLESCADESGRVTAKAGETRLFLYPPYKPRIVDAMLTNFHLPKSTLLMLVCVFADRSHVMAAYEVAKRERFRFYSYGDCMFLY